MKPLSFGAVQIGRPLFLLLYLIIPAVVLFYVWYRRRRRKSLVIFAAADLLPGVRTVSRWKQHLPAGLALLAMTLLVSATVDPSARGAYLSQRSQVVLVIDVSRSMEADDVAPTRIAAAQLAAERFVDKLPTGFEIGLVTFSEKVDVLATPTMDREVVRGKIRSLTTVAGTATGDALIQALNIMGTDPKGGVVVLLSDGVQTAGLTTIEQAAGTLRAAGVKAYSIALGTQEGRISVIDPSTSQLTTIEVPPDPDGLKLLSTVTGGETFEAVTVEELNRVYDSVGSELRPTEGLVGVGWTLSLGALILFLISGWTLVRFGGGR